MGLRTWGLEIGTDALKAVEVTRTWRGSRATNYGLFPLAGKASENLRREQVRALRELLPKLGKNGEEVLLVFPSQRTMVHRVPLPFRDRKRNEQVLKFEAEPLLPFPVDQLVIDFVSPERKAGGKEALVFAVQKEELGERISLLKEAGLDPGFIVPEPLPLFWLARELGLTSGRNGCLLDLENDKTTLIVWEGNLLVLARSIPAAAGFAGRVTGREPHLTAAVRVGDGEMPGGKDDRPEAAALARVAEEVKRTLLSYESGRDSGAVEKIFLTGAISRVPGLDAFLSERIQRGVAPADLGGEARPLLGNIPEDLRASLATAAGAALRPAADPVNFRRDEFSSARKVRQAKTRVKLLLAYGFVLGLLAVSWFSLDLYLQERRVRGLKEQIRQEFSKAAPEVKKVVNEVQQLKTLVNEERVRVNALGGVSGAGSPLDILRDLSGMADPAWKMRITELILDPDSLELNGEAGSFDSVNQFKTNLERSSRYREVQLKTARASGLENVIEFKFQMKRGPGA